MKEKWAAVDIGSNTVQLLVVESGDNHFRPCLSALRTTRLGASAQAGLLEEGPIADTLSALSEYRQILAGENISRLRVVATSAVRDAANRQQLLDGALRQCGWPIEVLSGQEEARLSFLGAASPFLAEGAKNLLLIDIGGSSSELIRWCDGDLLAESADVGAVRAKSRGWDEEKIYRHLAGTIKPQEGDSQKLAIGVGGTITTAAGLLLGCREYSREAIAGYCLTLPQIEELLKRLRPLSIKERCDFSPLLERRGEIICEGLLILACFFRLLGLEKLTVSGAGILEGCLRDLRP